MPHFVVDKIADALNHDRKPLNGSTVLILGLAYKKDIDDIRESPSLDVMTLLLQKGARVRYADPYVATLSSRQWHGGFDMHSEPLTAEALAAADCVAILTEHRAVDYRMVVESARLIVDTRNAIAGEHAHVLKLGAPAPRRVAPNPSRGVPHAADPAAGPDADNMERPAVPGNALA
jgi:UDP-N-acetyl-D-glucosamine dehydrogenase